MILGALLILIPLISWLDYLTTDSPIGFGEIVLGLIGVGIDIIGFLLNRKEKSSSKNTTTVASGQGQIATQGGRNIQLEGESLYIENYQTVEKKEKANNLDDKLIQLDNIQLNILTTIHQRPNYGIPEDILKAEYSSVADERTLNYLIQQLLELKYIQKYGTRFFIDNDGVGYLYNTKTQFS
jgi:hypothetical protein